MLLCMMILVTVAVAQQFHVVVYEATPGGIMAAIAASRNGKSVALLASGTHIGGMCSGGLGKTDAGETSVIGGLALEFFKLNGQHYGSSTPIFDLEPHVARDIFLEMLSAANVTLIKSAAISHVERDGDVITRLFTHAGAVFGADVFIDASYEGDLVGAANISFTIGRESIAMYNESLNGIRNTSTSHEFEIRVDPLDSSGNILPFLVDGPSGSGVPGDGDSAVESYNFRLCVTQNKSNLVPFTRPESYDPADWEIARRYFSQQPPKVPTCNTRAVPNSKYDANNCGPVSTDVINNASAWPLASFEERQVIWEYHKNYTRGLFWFLSSDESLPVSLRVEMQSWGLCKDEFTDTENWPSQLYVREARRMIGEQIFTQTYLESMHTQDIGVLSVGMGGYHFDTHNARRYVCRNASVCTKFQVPYAWNEGDVEVNLSYRYQHPAWLLYPKRSEITNLLSPITLSASHMGYGALRLEPQYMTLGHSAGVMAAEAIDQQRAVQELNMSAVSEILKREGQILWQAPPTPAPPAPPATCEFEKDVDYDHLESSWPSSSEQECCNQCARDKECKFAIYRYAGSDINTCWPGVWRTNRTSKVGTVVCNVSEN